MTKPPNFLPISNEMMPCPVPSAPPPPPLLPSPPTFQSKDSTPTTAISAFSAAPNLPSSHSPVRWSTGLCDCCEDVSSCCLTCWCPCVTFGRIAEIVDRGSTSCGVSGALYMLIMVVSGCSCLYSCFYRSKMRGIYFLEETPCSDCCVHCCCQECALCQEYRQLQNQGFDLSIGWYGNMERQRRGVAIPPVLQDGMSRQI